MLEYDDSQVYKLFEEMEPKRRLQAMKGAFKREANNVRSAAVESLRSEDIHTSPGLERGIRAVVYKKTAGFKVTVGTKKATRKSKTEYGMHTNRRGIKKPVLIWAEGGAPEKGSTPRMTKAYVMRGKRKIPRKRAAHSTGRMPALRFMLKTKYKVKDQVTNNLHEEIKLSVGRIARKYGCNTQNIT